MLLVSTSLELRILRTLTTVKNGRALAKLNNTLNPACFYSETGSEVYRRIMTLAKERGILIGWQELLNDPVLKESTRKRLQAFKKKPIMDRADLSGHIKQLHSYRRMRAMYFSAEYMLKQLKRQNVDPDKLYTEVNERIAEARISGDTEDWFVHIGQTDREARNFAKQLISDKVSDTYVPTGLNAFDRINKGIPLGSFFMLASTTSGGKSVLANQIGSNMAEASGRRVCIVQLEMSHIETGHRHVSRLSGINMSKIIDPRNLPAASKKKILRRWMRWHQKIKARGGLLTIFAPKEDLTFEEILLILKPFEYDVIILDYIGLLKGVDESDYPRLLGKVARLGKRYAGATNSIVAACAQLTEDYLLRYSRAMQEHAQNLWMWTYGEKDRESRIIKVKQPKSRNQLGFTFYLKEDFAHMRMRDLDDAELEKAKAQFNGAAKQDSKKRKRHFDEKKSKRVLQDNDFVDLQEAA